MCCQTNWVASRNRSPLPLIQCRSNPSLGCSCCSHQVLRSPKQVESGLLISTFICEKKACCSPLTGCFHRLVFGEFSLRLVDGRVVGAFGTPHLYWLTQHTPEFGLLTGVSLIGDLFLGLAVPTLDPLVLIHCCTDWTFSAPRLKQKAPAQQPCYICLECHAHNLH